MDTLTELLADEAVRLKTEPLPEAAIDSAKKLILDTLGVAIAGCRQPGIPEILAMARDWGGRPEASFWMAKDRGPLPNVAFCNAAMAHALDLDDIYPPAILHCMGMLVPTVMSCGQAENKGGEAVIRGLITGMEIAGRVGQAFITRCQGEQHACYLPTSIVGGFGVVAAAAQLKALDRTAMAHAFGIFYAQTSGNRQALFDQSLTKRLQPALAVRSALWAVDMAARGITGPLHALEGRAGLFKLFLQQEAPSLEAWTRSRASLAIEFCCIKRIASCGGAHPTSMAALHLAQAHALDPADIESVALYFGPKGNPVVGFPFELTGDLQVRAQFSAPYGVALALVRKDFSLVRFTAEAIAEDVETAHFAQHKVNIVTDLKTLPEQQEVPAGFSKSKGRPHVVEIKLKDDRILREERSPAQIFNPDAVSLNDAIEKFHDCVAFSKMLDRDKADTLVQRLMSLEQAKSLEPVLALLSY